jgi:hypothetical protein
MRLISDDFYSQGNQASSTKRESDLSLFLAARGFEFNGTPLRRRFIHYGNLSYQDEGCSSFYEIEGNSRVLSSTRVEVKILL